MLTDITDTNAKGDVILFDAQGRLCSTMTGWLRPGLARRGIARLPLQTGWVREVLAGRGEPWLSEMRLLTRRGESYGGAVGKGGSL